MVFSQWFRRRRRWPACVSDASFSLDPCLCDVWLSACMILVSELSLPVFKIMPYISVFARVRGVVVGFWSNRTASYVPCAAFSRWASCRSTLSRTTHAPASWTDVQSLGRRLRANHRSHLDVSRWRHPNTLQRLPVRITTTTAEQRSKTIRVRDPLLETEHPQSIASSQSTAPGYHFQESGMPRPPPKALVVLMGWLGAQPRYVAKYEDLYAKSGHVTVVCVPPPWTVFQRRTAERTVTDLLVTIGTVRSSFPCAISLTRTRFSY